MDPNTYDQVAAKLERKLNEKGTLVKFKVLSASQCIKEWASDSRTDTPLREFIIRHKVYIEGHWLAGRTTLLPEMITDSAIDITEIICEQSARSIAKMILAPND